MFPFLKICSASHHVFRPASKILPVLRRDAKLFLLKFPSSVRYFKVERDKGTESIHQDRIIVYQNDESQYFNRIKLFTVANFVIWTLCGVNTYVTLSEEPNLLTDELRQKWNENVRKREVTKKLIIGCIALGFLFVLAICFYLLRNVKQIRLIKSTRSVEFQTYSFFPSVRQFSVPLKEVSGVINRHAAKGYIPIKIKNTWFYFLVDVKGHFPDPFLFDNSIGVERDFGNTKS